jgi:cytochrome c oxidase subunit III
VLKTIFVAYLSWRGYFNKERHLGVTVNGIYWHFVVAVWLPLYLVLYWSPRLF